MKQASAILRLCTPLMILFTASAAWAGVFKVTYQNPFVQYKIETTASETKISWRDNDEIPYKPLLAGNFKTLQANHNATYEGSSELTFQYSGDSDPMIVVSTDSELIVIGQGISKIKIPKLHGTIEKIRLIASHLEFEKEKYFILSATTSDDEGAWLVRARDGKTARLGNGYLANTAAHAFTTTDGILSTQNPESPMRDIDLLAFDREAQFIPRGDGMTSVEGEQKSALDEVNKTFDDLEGSGTTDYAISESDREVIDQIKMNFSRPNRSSTILLGEAGTGKTTLIKQALREMGLPRTWEVKVLDSTTLTAGGQMIGTISGRVDAIVSASKYRPMIWFIDEFHSLKGAGTTKGNPVDVLEHLKTGLADGTLKLIATDTPMEFYEVINDPAMVRRLTRIQLPEPKDADVRIKLKSWAKQNGAPDVSDAVIDHVMKASSDFNATEMEPSRSVGLLEAVITTAQQKSLPIDIGLVNDTIKKIYRVDPALRDLNALRERTAKLPELLNERLIGLEALKSQLVTATRNALAGLNDGHGPRLSAYLDGPPGTGKTEIAKAYADAMNLPYKVIEMAQHTHPGDGAALMSEIGVTLRANPFSVIILDEIEKANPKVLESLLTFMSAERFTTYEQTTNDTRRSLSVSSKNATVFMTSNAGSKSIQEATRAGRQTIGFGIRDSSTDVAERFTRKQIKNFAMEAGLSEPLMDRMQIIMNTDIPSDRQLVGIIELHMKEQTRLNQQALDLKFDYLHADRFIDYLVKRRNALGLSTRDILFELKDFLKDRAGYTLFHKNYGPGKTAAIDLDPKKTPEHAVRLTAPTCSSFFGQ